MPERGVLRARGVARPVLASQFYDVGAGALSRNGLVS